MVTKAPGLKRFWSNAADSWLPRKRFSTPDWCAANVRLPNETSANPGPMDLDSRCFWREPLAMLDNPEVFTITTMAGAQDGKTITLMAALLSRSELDPAPAMLITPDKDSIVEGRDKIYEMALATPALRDRIPPRRLWNNRFIDLETMICYLAYPGSKQRLRGRTCKWVFASEVDVWVNPPRLGDTSRLIQARTKALAEYKIWYESTPTDETSRINGFYKAGDQRKFHVPCLHCGHWQELRFFVHRGGPFAGCGGIAGHMDDNGRFLSSDESRDAAYYVCERGCRIESGRKPEMVTAGVWVPKGQCVEDGRLVGTPAKGIRNVSYQISSLYSGKTFGDCAAAYVEHRENQQLREFFNNWLGLPFISGRKMPDWRTLGQRLAWPHRRGTVPADAYFLTCGADVQEDRTYAHVRAWGDRRSSWQVDWFEFGRDRDTRDDNQAGGQMAADLAQLDVYVLNPRFRIASGTNPWGFADLPVRLLGIDTNYRMFEIHEWVTSHAGDRVRSVRGDDNVDPKQYFRATEVERNARTGKPYPGGLILWGLASTVFRELLMQLWEVDPKLPGAWLLCADVLREGESYLRQLVNQPPIKERDRWGIEKVRWITRDKAIGEHSWDCEVINLALALMVTGGVWDASQWPAPAPPAPKIDSDEPLIISPRNGPNDFSAR